MHPHQPHVNPIHRPLVHPSRLRHLMLMQHSNLPLQIVVQRTMRSGDRIMAAQLGSRHDYPVLTLCYISLASIVDMYGFNGFQMICSSQLARLSSSLGFVPVRCLILIAPLRAVRWPCHVDICILHNTTSSPSVLTATPFLETT